MPVTAPRVILRRIDSSYHGPPERTLRHSLDRSGHPARAGTLCAFYVAFGVREDELIERAMDTLHRLPGSPTHARERRDSPERLRTRTWGIAGNACLTKVLR